MDISSRPQTSRHHKKVIIDLTVLTSDGVGCGYSKCPDCVLKRFNFCNNWFAVHMKSDYNTKYTFDM